MQVQADLGQIFGEQYNDAVRYDTYRPKYPHEVIDELINVSGIKLEEAVIEIGSGTGIATLSLAERGLAITAIEPSQNMLDLARYKMPASRFPGVRFKQQTFQEYFEQAQGMDQTDQKAKIIAAFTAFHWLQPSVRLEQCRELLLPNGVLAISLSNHLTGGEGDPLYEATRNVIETYVEKPVDDGDPNTVSVIYDGHVAADINPPLKEDELSEGLFELSKFVRFPMQTIYTAEQYVGLMGTFSAVKNIENEVRNELLDRLATIVRHKFNNQVNVSFAPSLGIYRPKLDT